MTNRKYINSGFREAVERGTCSIFYCHQGRSELGIFFGRGCGSQFADIHQWTATGNRSSFIEYNTMYYKVNTRAEVFVGTSTRCSQELPVQSNYHRWCHHNHILQMWIIVYYKKINAILTNLSMTGAPKQRYWQNRETANVGLDSSVGRAPARQSGGRRFKSRSSQFSLFIQIYLQICTQSVSLVVYYMIFIKKLYPFMVHPLLPVPRSYRNLGVIPG